jgi:hypothetical protein
MEGKTYWDTEREQEYQPINNAHPLKLFARNRFPVSIHVIVQAPWIRPKALHLSALNR